MKKLIFLVLCLFTLSLQAQDIYRLKNIQLQEKEDYAKAEKDVLIATGYLLDNSLSNNYLKRTEAFKFVIRWMYGTPDYTFEVKPLVFNLTKKNPEVYAIWFACMIDYVLKNPDSATDTDLVEDKSLVKFLDYCGNPKNEVVPKSVLKKFIAAKNEGKLEEIKKKYQ